jgi:hypothetical protein
MSGASPETHSGSVTILLGELPMARLSVRILFVITVVLGLLGLASSSFAQSPQPRPKLSPASLTLLGRADVVAELGLSETQTSQVKKLFDEYMKAVKDLREVHEELLRQGKRDEIKQIQQSIAETAADSSGKVVAVISEANADKLVGIHLQLGYPRSAFSAEAAPKLAITPQQRSLFSQACSQYDETTLGRYKDEGIRNRAPKERLEYVKKLLQEKDLALEKRITTEILSATQLKEYQRLMGPKTSIRRPELDTKLVDAQLHLRSTPRPVPRLLEPYSTYMLVQCPSVQEALKLPADQARQASALGKKHQEMVDQFYDSMAKVSLEEKRKRLTSWDSFTGKRLSTFQRELAGVIGEHSLSRLGSLHLQLRGPSALLGKDLVTFLNLSQDEQKWMREAAITYAQANKPFEGADPKEVYRLVPPEMNQAMLSVLPEEKQQIWKLLLGDDWSQDVLRKVHREFNALEAKRRKPF